MTVTYPVRLELAVGAGDPPGWVDVSTYLLADDTVTVAWGGSGEDITVEPTRATFTVDNTDGRFTPGNTASPYSPLIRVGTGVRISVSVGGTWSVRFTGTADDWSVAWSSPGQAKVSVTATDALKQLSRQNVPAHGLFIESVTGDSPHALYLLEETASPARLTGPGNPAAMTSAMPTAALTTSILGGGTIKWAETDPPPGMYSKVVLFEPGTADCCLIGDPESLYLIPPQLEVDSSSGTGVGCWIHVPAAPTAEMFLFGYDLFYLSIDQTMRVWLHSPYEPNPADKLTAGPIVTADTWHYVGAYLRRQLFDTHPVTDAWEHLIAVDGAATTTNLSGSWFHGSIPTTKLLVGSVGGPGRAPFSAAGLSTYNWKSIPVTTGTPDFVDHYRAACGYADGDTSSARINRWLALAGTGGDIETGSVTVGMQQGDASILSLISDVTAAERGAFYASRDGVLTFRNRDHTLYHAAPDLVVDAAVLGASPEFTMDDGDLINDLIVEGATGVTFRLIDDASVVTHGRYTGSMSTLDVSKEAPRGLAAWLLHFAAWPSPQCQKIGLELGLPGVSAAAVLALLVGGIVRVTGAPPSAPSPTVDLQIIGCTETITRARYVFDLTTRTAQEFTEVGGGWRLDDAVLSVLGRTTTLTT